MLAFKIRPSKCLRNFYAHIVIQWHLKNGAAPWDVLRYYLPESETVPEAAYLEISAR